MDFDAYAERMLRYYTRRVDPATDRDAQGFADEYDRNFAQEGHHARELDMEIQRALAGRDVLELAAGMGQYARFLVRTARSVLATDASPRATSPSASRRTSSSSRATSTAR